MKWYQIKDIETGKTKVSVDVLISVCENFAIDSDWLLTGRGDLLKTETATSSKIESSNITIIEHQELAKRFKDPEKAKEVNENLIELEELNDDLYQDVAKHIKSSVNAARIIKKSSKKIPKKEQSTKRQVNGK